MSFSELGKEIRKIHDMASRFPTTEAEAKDLASLFETVVGYRWHSYQRDGAAEFIVNHMRERSLPYLIQAQAKFLPKQRD